MIKVLFFAQVRELVGTDATEVAADFPTVEALRQHMAAQSDRWALALEDGKLLAAVNQTLVSFDHPLTDGDEVAFPAGNRRLRWQKPKLLLVRSRSA